MLVVTSTQAIPPRAIINVKALEAHRSELPSSLVEDIITELPPEIPVTEKSMEALLLKSKGPYNKKDIEKLMSLLTDEINHPINLSIQGKDNAQLLGFIAIDLAKYHPHAKGLKKNIIKRIQEMENYSYFTNGEPLPGTTFRSHYYMDNFVAALYLIDKTKAREYIAKYNLSIESIQQDIKLEIPNK